VIASISVTQARLQRHEVDMEDEEGEVSRGSAAGVFKDAVLAGDDSDELSEDSGAEDDPDVRVRDGFVEANADEVRLVCGLIAVCWPPCCRG
jgi:hypothetical protein